MPLVTNTVEIFITNDYIQQYFSGVGLAVGLSVLGLCILISVILILVFLYRGKKYLCGHKVDVGLNHNSFHQFG